MKTRFFKLVLLLGVLLLAACQVRQSPSPSPMPPVVANPTLSSPSMMPPPSATPTAKTDQPTVDSEPARPAIEPTSAAIEQAGPTAQTNPTTAAPTASSPLSPPGSAATPTAAPGAPQSQPTQAVLTPQSPGTVPIQECQDLAAFYGDITIPDGTFFRAGEKFTKTWRFRNNGECTWTPDYQVVFAGGENMNAPLAIPFPAVVVPGEQIDISIEMQAPGRGGSYTSSWEFSNPGGARFGTGQGRSTPFWATIQVSYVDSQGAALPSPVTASALPASGAQTPAAALPPGCAGSLNPGFPIQVIALINQERAQNGLPGLQENSLLNNAALSHSADMACNNFLSHTGSDGSSWYDRISSQGYPANKSRENIYAGTASYGGDPADAVNWWLNSAIHRAAILNSEVSEIGAGYVLNPGSDFGGYYTVVFGRP